MKYIFLENQLLPRKTRLKSLLWFFPIQNKLFSCTVKRWCQSVYFNDFSRSLSLFCLIMTYQCLICIHVTHLRSKGPREQVSSDLSINEKHCLLFIPRMSDQREAWVKHYVAGSALMVFPWDKTSRTGRDTGFSYTCAVNLELWIKVNKIAEVGETGETFFTFTFITHKRQKNLPAIFWYKQQVCQL